SVATPAASVPVPSEVVPSKNSTVPVGTPAPGATAVTVAVKVVVWPSTDGSGALSRAVAVAALFTPTAPPPRQPSRSSSPLYVASIEIDPVGRTVVVRVATPPDSVATPSWVWPALNVTVPVGVPAPGATVVTVAARVLAWPKTDGSGSAVIVIAVDALATLATTGPELPLKL